MTQMITNGSPLAPESAQRLHVDWTRCDGRGLCVELLPELFDRDEWGFPRARAPHSGSDVAVPPDLETAARDAVALCPVLALTLSEPRR